MNIDTKNSPLVTIAIPTFNRAAYLVEAIESALAQTYGNIEVLISNNASTDNTPSVIRSAVEADKRVRSLTQTHNIGMVGNWNACLEAAQGRYFLLLSDDDVLEPDAVGLLVTGLAASQVCFAYGKVAYIGERGGTSKDGAPEFETGSEMVAGYSRGERAAYPSATLMKTDEVRGCGGYPDTTGTATDFALLLLLLRHGGLVRFFDRPVARYRMHESALSFTDTAANSYLKLFEWLQSENRLPPDWVDSLQNYCRAGIHRWGWSQSLRGNAAGGRFATDILANMPRSGMYRLSLALRHLPLVTWMGRKLWSRIRLNSHRIANAD